MIDRLLQKHLEPIARDYHYWHLVARAGPMLGGDGDGGHRIDSAASVHRLVGGVGLSSVHRGDGCLGGVAPPTLAKKPTRLPHDCPANRGGEPKLHSLLLTAVEQQPATATGGLNYLQQRVIREALDHNRNRPWGTRIFEKTFFAQCGHWLALIMFVGVLLGLRIATPAGRAHFLARGEGVSVTPGDTSIERGSGLVVLARFDGRLPTEATLVIKPVNENERRVPLAKNLDDPVFGGSVPEVNRSLSYRVEYGARQTREFTVTVFEYPKLERADAKLTFPEYTACRKRQLPTRAASARSKVRRLTTRFS